MPDARYRTFLFRTACNSSCTTLWGVRILGYPATASQIRSYCYPHCNGNSVYLFLFWELRGISTNFHIHVSVSDLYIPRIGPHISSSRKGRPIVGIYNSLKDTWMWKLGLRPRYSFSGNICIKFLAFCLCSAALSCARRWLLCHGSHSLFNQHTITFVKTHPPTLGVMQAAGTRLVTVRSSRLVHAV